MYKYENMRKKKMIIIIRMVEGLPDEMCIVCMQDLIGVKKKS